MQKNSSNSGKTKNWVMVASTGSGKSRTGNFILGKDYFVVGDEMNSCTAQVSHSMSKLVNVRVLDTPGFGDHRMEEDHIDSIMRQLTHRIVGFDDTSTNQIDLFVMVVKLDPRPASLKDDLEHLRALFGTRALKSTILLPIPHQCPKPLNDAQFHQSIPQAWPQIISILKQAKQEEFNQNWYVRWDNVNPRPNQLQQLLTKSQYISPYTHQMFLAAQKEIQMRIDEKVKKEVEKQKEILEEKYKHDKRMLENEIRNMEKAHEKRRLNMKKNAQRAQQQMLEFREQIAKLQEDTRKQLAEEMKKLRIAKQQQQQQLSKYFQLQREKFQKEFRRVEKENAEKIKQLNQKIAAEAKKPRPVTVVHRKSGGCFWDGSRVVVKKGEMEPKEIKINEVVIGDKVLAFNEKGQYVYDEVGIIDYYAEQDRSLVGIWVEGCSQPLILTNHHKIYKLSQNAFVLCRSDQILPNDILLKTTSNSIDSLFQKILVTKVQTLHMKVSVRNLITANTYNIVVNNIHCSVHCDGDWGDIYFKIGTLMWRYISRSIPMKMLRFQKWIKNMIKL